MHVFNSTDGLSKIDLYREIKARLGALFAGERNDIANAANMCAVLYHSLPEVNWAGFYFLRGSELVLGPFQGNIACDAASRSEIVVPLIRNERLLGVLDLDSPRPSRFDHDDSVGLNDAVRLLMASCDLHVPDGPSF